MKRTEVRCFYCRAAHELALPCKCPSCGKKLRKLVKNMKASELFEQARLNGLVLSLEWQTIEIGPIEYTLAELPEILK